MPDDDSVTLNLDSSQTLTRLAHALTIYARIVPGAAVAKVTFAQVPFVNIEQDLWRATATLECTGELKRTEQPSAESDFLDGVKPVPVFKQTWEGTGSGCVGAVEGTGDSHRFVLGRSHRSA